MLGVHPWSWGSGRAEGVGVGWRFQRATMDRGQPWTWGMSPCQVVGVFLMAVPSSSC
ncbi:hypothetical protein B0T18DRAFT_406409 [Schizothecium vesticola]|uniref:Uncharacterized protein n=1 Tax=Schizothecium vesticola TaxID=314040 RepID=A0AA40F1C1_9PEZI|nr:hypothetical protein B0T18DRAFT_406409 [Schizothecium vesticola]